MHASVLTGDLTRAEVIKRGLQRAGRSRAEVEDFIVRLLITKRDVPARGEAICLDKTDLAECKMQNRRCTLLSLEDTTGTL